MIEKEEIIKERIRYYYDEYNIYKLTQICKNREVAILDYDSPFFLRGNVIMYENMMRKFLQMFNVSTIISRNLYISSAKFSKMPNFLTKPKDIDKNIFFFNEVKNNILHYDLLIDFDVKENNTKEIVYQEVKRFAIHLKVRNISYYAIESGNGYHIVLDKLNFPFDLDGDTLIHYYNYGKQLKKDFTLQYYDLKNLGVWNRIQKMPLSMVKNKICNYIEV